MSDDFWDHVHNGRQAQPLNDVSLTYASHRPCTICGNAPYSTDTYAIVIGASVYCGRCYSNVRDQIQPKL
jgi:hypothetical protein